jgi:hypothetical protein
VTSGHDRASKVPDVFFDGCHHRLRVIPDGSCRRLSHSCHGVLRFVDSRCPCCQSDAQLDRVTRINAHPNPVQSRSSGWRGLSLRPEFSP